MKCLSKHNDATLIGEHQSAHTESGHSPPGNLVPLIGRADDELFSKNWIHTPHLALTIGTSNHLSIGAIPSKQADSLLTSRAEMTVKAKTQFLGLAVLATIGSPSVASAQSANSSEQEIRAVDAEWSADLHGHRLDEVMQNYDENALFLVNNQPIMEGKPAIRKWFSDRLATPGYSAKFVPKKIAVSSSRDMAYETGVFEATVMVDGELMRSVGKHLVTWRWNGKRWVVTAEAISVDGPPTKASP